MTNTQKNVVKLTASIVGELPVTLVYSDLDGVVSIRVVKAKSIERCASGVTVVRTFDLNREAPRTFRLANILRVEV